MHSDIPPVFLIWQYSSIITVHLNNMSWLDIPKSLFFQKFAFSARAIKRLWELSWSMWMVHSGNCGFLAPTELFQKPLPPTSPTRTSKISMWLATATTTGAWLLMQRRRTNSLGKMIEGLLEGGWTMWAARLASFTGSQEWWRQRILIYISIKVSPSQYCVHVNMRRVCFCHHSMALIHKKLHLVYRGSNYQQLTRGLRRVCANSVSSEGCPAVSGTSPVVVFTQTQSSDTVDRGALWLMFPALLRACVL